MKKGFSFIEVVVVIGVLAFALPTLYAIFFLILQQQVHSAKLIAIKKEGSFISDVMTGMIRSKAIGIYTSQDTTATICSNTATQQSISDSPNPLYFMDADGSWFYFESSGIGIASASSLLATPLSLTSDRTYLQSLTFSCSSSGFGSPIATINYTLCYNNGTVANPNCGTGNSKVELPFQVTATLGPH